MAFNCIRGQCVEHISNKPVLQFTLSLDAPCSVLLPMVTWLYHWRGPRKSDLGVSASPDLLLNTIYPATSVTLTFRETTLLAVSRPGFLSVPTCRRRQWELTFNWRRQMNWLMDWLIAYRSVLPCRWLVCWAYCISGKQPVISLCLFWKLCLLCENVNERLIETKNHWTDWGEMFIKWTVHRCHQLCFVLFALPLWSPGIAFRAFDSRHFQIYYKHVKIACPIYDVITGPLVLTSVAIKLVILYK